VGKRITGGDFLFRNYYRFIHDLQRAIQGELEAIAYYQSLISLAPETDREEIQQIRADEQRHAQILSQLYFNLTGRPPVTIPVEPPRIPSYLEGLEEAVGGELDAVEVYRNLILSTYNQQIRDSIFEIMVDEQEHATRLTLLYAKNKRC
jgi:rubrerythrin